MADGFPPDGNLFEAGMDSMAVMQLIVIAEERFGAVIGPEDAGRFFSPGVEAARIRDKRVLKRRSA